jgi:hypothetical protein
MKSLTPLVSIALTLLALATPVHSKGYWVPFYTQPDNGDIFYFDNLDIRIQNFGSGARIVSVDVLVNKFSPYVAKSGAGVNSMTTVYSYNCFNRMIRFTDVVMFSGKDGSGARVEVSPTSGEWREVRGPSPTPALASQLQKYCG